MSNVKVGKGEIQFGKMELEAAIMSDHGFMWSGSDLGLTIEGRKSRFSIV